MPQEIRSLLFSHPESTEAVLAYARKAHFHFPENYAIIKAAYTMPEETGNAPVEGKRGLWTELNQIQHVKSDNSYITLTIFNNKTRHRDYIRLPADLISAALIEYCLANKVMMPAVAEKILRLTEFNLCLDVNFNNPMAGVKSFEIEDL